MVSPSSSILFAKPAWTLPLKIFLFRTYFGNFCKFCVEIEVKPELNEWSTKRIEMSLYSLLLNMKCSEPECTKPAELMYKRDNHNKDLRCKDHVYSLTKDKSNYRDMEFFWSDLKSTLETTKREVMKCQVLLCIVESKEFQQMLGLKRMEELEKIKDKLNRYKLWIKFRNIIEFEEKVTSKKVHNDFDIFAFLERQISAIDQDIQKAYNIIGPFLAETYSSKILEKIQKIEDEDIALSVLARGPSTRATRIQQLEESKKKKVEQAQRGKRVLPSFNKQSSVVENSTLRSTMRSSLRIGGANALSLSRRGSALPMKRDGSVAFMPIKRRKHDEDFDIPAIGESVTTLIRVPMKTPTIDPKNPIIEPVNYKIITVLAALKDDYRNQTEKAQNHIDFLFKLRDRYPAVRKDIDKFIEEKRLKPSKKFESTRVIANTPEIKQLLHKHGIDKNAKIDSNYVLDLNLGSSRRIHKFFKDCYDFQMPKIKKLNIMNVNKADDRLKKDLHRFLSYTMASHILELYFGASGR